MTIAAQKTNENAKIFFTESNDFSPAPVYHVYINTLVAASRQCIQKKINNKTANTIKQILENSLISNSIVQNLVNTKKTNIEYKNIQANEKLAIFLCFLYFKYINLCIFFCSSGVTSHIKKFYFIFIIIQRIYSKKRQNFNF